MKVPSKKLLVVDDDPDMQEFFQTILGPKGKGYAVSGVVEAALALPAIQKDMPDLVILDVMMEEADSGFKLANLLSQKFALLPILLLSSIADASEGFMDTLALPVQRILQKPITPERLIEEVEQILSPAPAE